MKNVIIAAMKPHLHYAHRYWSQIAQPGDCVIDATVGNGYDTLFLANLLNGSGKLIGYDIQQEALDQTLERLKTLSPDQQAIVCLKKQSHAYFEESGVKLIVYNLGYLPGGDKKITTLCDSTLESLKKGMDIVLPGGAISITCYPGHPEGAEEEVRIKEFLATLPSKRWTVCYHQWINRPLAPSLIWLESMQCGN